MPIVKSLGLDTKGIRGEFFAASEAPSLLWPRVTFKMKSNANKETLKWLGSAPMPKLKDDTTESGGLVSYSFDITNKTYAGELIIDREELEDEQVDQIKAKVGEFGVSWGVFKDSLLKDMFKDGATTGNNAYDALTYFNDAHLMKDSEGVTADTIDNNFTSAAATGTDPTKAEFEAAFADGIEKMRAYLDERGVPKNLPGTGKWMVLVPPQMELVARQTLQATLTGGGDTNVLAAYAELVVWDWLEASADTFYIMNVGSRGRQPFIYQERTAAEFEALDSDEYIMEHDYAKYIVRQRFVLAYGEYAKCARHVFT